MPLRKPQTHKPIPKWNDPNLRDYDGLTAAESTRYFWRRMVWYDEAPEDDYQNWRHDPTYNLNRKPARR